MSALIMVFLTAIVTGLIYTLLHEGGHALMALTFGAKITAFEVNFFRASPHISYAGDLTSLQRGLVSLAGPIFPWLIALAVIPLIKSVKDPFAKFGFASYSVSCLASLLPNAVLPVVHAMNGSGQGEDVVNFIVACKSNPFLTSAFFILLIVFTVWYLLKMGQAVSILKRFKTETKQGALRVNKPIMVFLAGLVLLFIFHPRGTKETFANQYQNYVKINFNELTENPMTVFEFELVEENTLDLGYRCESEYEVMLKLISTDNNGFLFKEGTTSTIFHGNETVSNGIYSGFPLEAGHYGLELTTTAKRGYLELGFSLNEPDDWDLEFAEMLRLLQSGSFTEHSYSEKGYELVYHKQLSGKTTEIVYEISLGLESLEISAFVVGHNSEYSLTYFDEHLNEVILADSRATVGRTITPKGNDGRLEFALEHGDAELFLYVKTSK